MTQVNRESIRWHRCRRVGLALTAMALLVFASTAHAASPPPLLQFCEPGSGAGQCKSSNGIAVDPNSGNVYVADGSNYRIAEFTIWGEFVRAWGGGVVNGGASGIGIVSPGSEAVTQASTTNKAFVPGMAIEGTGIAAGTTVVSVGPSRINLSQPGTGAATGAPTALSSPEAPGNVSTNELESITLTATGGTFGLEFKPPAPGLGASTTSTSIPYNASPAQVQSALEGLPNIGAGNVAVISANPGGAAGVPGGPYTVEFKGRFADTNVVNLGVVPGAAPFTAAEDAVAPVRQGASAPEVCTGIDCRQGVDGDRAGQFGSPKNLAIDSSGNVYVYEGPECTTGYECVNYFGYAKIAPRRVQEFNSSGDFLLMFGGAVNQGGGTPSNPGNVCTAQNLANGDVCGAGKAGTGNGEFADGREPRRLAVGPNDEIYVGDKDRIQRFNVDGTYSGQIALPEPGVAEGLAIDPQTGDLYFSYHGINVQGQGSVEAERPNVHRLDSVTGEEVDTLKVAFPALIAVDRDGGVYVNDESISTGSPIDPRNHPPRLLKFDAQGDLVETLLEGEVRNAEPVTTTSACGIGGVDIFLAHPSVAFGEVDPYIRGYGSPPDPNVCPPPQVPPTIVSQYAISVGSTDATVAAQINPHFWPNASYYVEYGTGECSTGGCDRTQPVPPGSTLTAATTDSAVTTSGVFLQGLNPETTYHYRFVSSSAGGGPIAGAESTLSTFPAEVEPRADCPNQVFRTGTSARLPACRAYEMVSPVDKNGGDVAIGPIITDYGSLAEVANDGARATFSSLRSFADPSAAPLVSQYLSVRGPEGWSTHSISPPRQLPSLSGVSARGRFKGFSDDLCSAWLLQDADVPLAPGAPSGFPNLYRRDNCGAGDKYELLTTTAPPGFDPKAESIESFYVPGSLGASADSTHTVFRADAALTGNACTTSGIYQVYVSSVDTPLRLVSVLPNGKAACSHSSAGSYYAGSGMDRFRESSVYHAISRNGSRVFWTATANTSPAKETIVTGGTGALYVRVNATQAPSKISGGNCTEATKACTKEISSSASAQYWGADLDGTKAIYTTGLTVGELDLFEYDVDQAQSSLIASDVLGVIGQSDDLSRVYFMSTAVLGDGQANSAGETAQAEQPNVYLDEDGEITFVARVAAEEAVFTNASAPALPASVIPALRTSRVSSDGQHLVFTSARSLTGYDNVDIHSGKPDAEVYLYGAEPGSGPGTLACISCNPSGARPTGRGDAKAGQWSAASIPGWAEHQRPTRLLSDDGRRLFFNSFDALVPRDGNGHQDVYEWQQAESAQACRNAGAEVFSSNSGGCLSLISSGQSPADSDFIDASADGSDVFITTESSLLPQDPGLVDVYDARVGGGYPPIPTTPPACEGEACQGPLAPPNDPTPASSSFEGAGNVKKDSTPASRCRKNQARRKGRCVAKHGKKKRNPGKRSHNRRVGR